MAVDRCDTGVEPPHAERRHRAARDVRRIFQPLQHEAIADLLLKLVERRLPVRRNPARLDVDRRRVPAKCLVEDRLAAETSTGAIAPGTQQVSSATGAVSPRVLQPAARELLRVEVFHVREIAAGRAHVAPAVQPPAGAALHAVLQRGQRVEIHQQRRARKRREVDVDELLLDRPAGQVGSPAFAPVADRRDVHVVQIRMSVVAFAQLRRPAHSSTLAYSRIVGIGRPDRAVLVRRCVGALRTRGLYQSGIGCLSSYGMIRIASRWP